MSIAVGGRGQTENAIALQLLAERGVELDCDVRVERLVGKHVDAHGMDPLKCAAFYAAQMVAAPRKEH